MTCRAQIFAISVMLLSLVVVLSGQRPTLAGGTRKGATAVDVPNCDRAQFRLVLDVGHTAEAFGATSARNVPEYDFNLRLAMEIDQSLINAGFTKTVLLITQGPKMSSLLERVAVANELSANLFLSIHHDSVPDAFLQDWEYDGKPSHFSDRFAGYSLFVSYENHYLNASVVFGRLLGTQLKDRGLQYDGHYTKEFMGRYQHQLVDSNVGLYRYDQLVVLRETKMPAILLEAGSIINRNEEILMNSPERRALISAAVTRAVEKLCER
jgi:N-acetylmuramoyl-L-alanine amidase